MSDQRLALIAGAASLFAAGAACAEPAGPTLDIFGRVYADYVSQDVDRQTGADFTVDDRRIRTLRLGADGRLVGPISYKAEVATTDEGGTQWEDLYLEYAPTKALAITAGNFKTVGLENLSSSRYSMFMEKGPFTDSLDIGRVMHVRARLVGEGWTLAAAVSGDSINDSDPAEALAGDSKTTGASVRGTFAPVDDGTTTVHLGAWARVRERQDGGLFNYRTRNNTNFGARYTATGAIGEGDRMIGLEGLMIRKSVTLQGEWATAKVDRRIGGDGDFGVYYVEASWFPTGERRAYKSAKGEVDRTKVRHPVTEGGAGAVELALRYDALDLTDASAAASAGEYTAWTAGANWYLTSHLRVMGNYSRAKNDLRAVGADVDVDTVQFRLQYDF